MPQHATSEEGLADEGCFVELRDRTPVIVRPARSRDREEVAAFAGRLSPDSIELRFAGPMRSDAVIREVLGPPAGAADRLSLVMETLDRVPRMVGNAEYVRFQEDPAHAEVAFLIADEFQGRGAGSILLQELARRARPVGIRWFTAVVLAENFVMRDIFLRAGFPYRVDCDGPTLRIDLDIGESPASAAGPFPVRVERAVPVA